MKVLSHAQMRTADQAAIAAGIPELVLMENAAYGLLRAIEQRFAPLGNQRIAIFCGKGNNGGDGLALARLLAIHHQPQQLRVLLAFAPEELSESAQAQLRMLEALGIAYSMQWPMDLDATTIAVDALLGTGISGAPRSPVAEAIERINSLPLARRVAVDIPSAGRVKVDLTVTFAAPKPEHVLPPDCDGCGELVIAPIGIPKSFLDAAAWNLTTGADLRPIGSPRPRASHKGNFGHVLLLGGAVGKPGALRLASGAAMETGAGWVTLSSPDPDFIPHLPDLMQTSWPTGLVSLEKFDVVGVGPGLGTDGNAKQIVDELFDEFRQPLVLDADALNLLAPLTRRPRLEALRVLTPHPGEMRRLLGRAIEDRVADALELAAIAQSVVVLKGQRTVIAFPDGEVWINPTGSPALAKAGSGDVLTGMLASLLAQYPGHAREAILAAVYLHGRCGELAAEHGHEMTSLASRLCQYLPEALCELT